jgi:hypothetical protein
MKALKRTLAALTILALVLALSQTAPVLAATLAVGAAAYCVA